MRLQCASLKHWLTHVPISRISSLDVALAARILLLTNPPYPDATIKDLITTSYPNLVLHAQHVQERILGSNTLPLKVERHGFSLWSLLPSSPFSFKPVSSPRSADRTDEEKHIDRMRWGFVGLVVGVVCAYMAVLAPSRLELANEIRHQRKLSQLYGHGYDDEEDDEEYEGEEEGLDFPVGDS